MILYVEKNTSNIYEVQLFETYALVRLATPSLEKGLRKIGLIEFGSDFDEFCGDHGQVREFIEDATQRPTDLQEEAV